MRPAFIIISPPLLMGLAAILSSARSLVSAQQLGSRGCRKIFGRADGRLVCQGQKAPDGPGTDGLCVSCHTTVPYVIARPALRRAMQVSSATPQEVRLIEETHGAWRTTTLSNPSTTK